MDAVETTLPRDQPTGAAPRLLYVVTEDWYFLSHRLPMARAAQRAGFEVHVATNVVDGAAGIASEGFILHPLPFVRGRLSPVRTFATIRALRRVLARVEPTVVHHVAVQPTVLGAIAAIGYPWPSVNAITGLGYTFIGNGAKQRLLRFAIGLVLRLLVDRGRNVVLVQNPDDRDFLQSLGLRGSQIVLIPGSGVDVETLRPTPEPEGKINVAFVGRLLEDKGIRSLIGAHRLLREKGVAVSLLLAGTPDPANPASASIEEIETWSREPGITWLGHVSDIRTVWARAHIAVLPSRREGLPKSLLEAAACGRPMVATDVPGCREVVIPGETGLLVPVDDPQALAAAIERLAGAPDLRARYGQAARRRTVSEFSAAAIGEATSALYRRLSTPVQARGGR
jgi:glycosyltransferase involved in cell wall biosynthesis